VTLDDGPSLFHAGGTALVIHGADDNKTDPAGSAGPRIACGVIEKAKS
jgi:Cu-Zn family superoxide dismutase